MTLEDWLNKGWVKRHHASAEEIKNLFNVVDRDISQSKLQGMTADTSLSLAYNAALQCCAAALAASGYRAGREAHHYRLIQSLGFTLQPGQPVIDLMDDFRNKRNISDYERAGMVSTREAEEMLRLAVKMRSLARKWITENHPALARDL